MMLPSSTLARDRRTALYLADRDSFLQRLQAELTLLYADATHYGLTPAVRLNGTSDIPWEQLQPTLFESFFNIQFFDYTKLPSRMEAFLSKREWPPNYHLTFSLDHNNHRRARRFLDSGGNVAAVFWPVVPSSWSGFPTIDGERHDARFLDPKGSVVGLQAKGRARVDLDGFTLRPCPRCLDKAPELALLHSKRDTHLTTIHECRFCGYQLEAKWLVQNNPRTKRRGTPHGQAA